MPLLPRISNFDDFDPLKLEPDVDLRMVAPGEPLPVCDLVILPGTKATIADLAFFRAQGWDIDLLAHARRGGKILGICGGYQMLGQTISDPLGMEGPPGAVAGLGLLDVETELTTDKIFRACAGVSIPRARLSPAMKCMSGSTQGPDCARPCCALRMAAPTARSLGRWRDPRLLCPWPVRRRRPARRAPALDRRRAFGLGYEAEVERMLDALAAHLERAYRSRRAAHL